MSVLTAHLAWCQPIHCTSSNHTDIIHRHLIGSIAGVKVWVQRTDTTRDDASHLYGRTAVHLSADEGQPLTRHLDTLRALLTAAELFADQVEGVR
ncbi:hypothetical protein [Verrucosispora sp. NA02020]|uniref:hypothetical protein n=1 Tax=Verrucosispora sp. NA02020 TaxID=2742132 RepID=UPI001591B6E8|nr:hypothetical protein [Verrucosispora sp. NA02020]QKW15447.1 hypothetical protein HUT12_23545 [Verrucosispora sp. NA02020]